MSRALHLGGGLAALALCLSGCPGDSGAGADVPTLTAAELKPRPEPPPAPPEPPPPSLPAGSPSQAGEAPPSPAPADAGPGEDGGSPAPAPPPPAVPAGRVALGLADIQGSLERSSLGGELKDKLPGLQTCYQRALVKDPALFGELEVEFRVGRQGQVSVVRLTKPGPPGALPACVLRKVAGWSFSPGGEVSVRLPLSFRLSDPVAGGCTGSLDRQAILEVINRSIRSWQTCYERAALKNPGFNAQGRLLAQWIIQPSGQVSGVIARQSTFQDAQVVECLLGSIRTLSFPKPQGGCVEVSYPIHFHGVGF